MGLPILKVGILRGKKFDPVPVPYVAVRKASVVCQPCTRLTHPSDDQLRYRWGQMKPVWRWCLAHIRVPHLCKSSSLCGLHPLMYINRWVTLIPGLVLLKLENTKHSVFCAVRSTHWATVLENKLLCIRMEGIINFDCCGEDISKNSNKWFVAIGSCRHKCKQNWAK